MQYAVFQIGSRQYKISPGQTIEVDKISTPGILHVDKVLLAVDGEKMEVGNPYLKKVLQFEVVENVKKAKIRVATYKAKANHRRVIGSRREVSRIKLVESVKKIMD